MSKDGLRAETAPQMRRVGGDTHVTSRVGSMIGAAIIVFGLYIGRPVVVPVVMAVLLAFVLAPIVSAVRRLRVPHALAVLVVVVSAFGALVSIGTVIAVQIGDLAKDLPRYETELRSKVRDLKGAAISSPAMERAAQTLQDLKDELTRPETKTVGPDTDAAATPPPGGVAQPPSRPIPVEIRTAPSGSIDGLLAIVQTLIEPVTMFAIVVVFVFFILLQRQDLRDRVIRLIGANDLQRTTAAMTDAGTRLSRYLLTLTLLNLAYGTFIGAALWLIGIPAAVLWGIVAALMRFVPFIGSFIAGAFPAILAAAIDPGWSTLAMTLVLIVAAEFLMGQFIEPLVQSQTTGLSPVAVLAAAAFWAMLWGPIGLILAVPLTVCVVVLGQHVPTLGFLYVMLGDKPALAPSERFYQRALSGDANEVSEQAEVFARTASISAFYEDVAIGALRLAQTDAERGVLNASHISRIADTVEAMVDNLWDLEDIDRRAADAPDEAAQEESLVEASPPASPLPGGATHLPILAVETLPARWREGTPVLCVPARTAIDHAASRLVAHILSRHGLTADVPESTVLSTSALRTLGRTDTEAVCICSLGERERSMPVRFLARRLRRIWPDAHIVAVLFAADTTDSVDVLKGDTRSIDAVVTTLTGAVESVMSAARVGTDPAGSSVADAGAEGNAAPDVTHDASRRKLPAAG